MFIFFDDSDLGTTSTPTFSPADISGLTAWWKADSLALSNNDPVSTWTDSSGNGHDGTASLTTRPTYIASWNNSKPALYFDGSNDYMTITSSFYDSDWTQFVVFEKDTGSNFPTMTTDSAASLGYGVFPSSGTTYVSDRSYYTYVNSQDGSGKHYWSLKVTSAHAFSLWKDGTSLTLQSPTLVTNTTSNFTDIGRRAVDSAYANGWMAEMLMYNSALSDTDRGNVETYLKNKYGL
jgi:hypothetical protein